METVRILRGNHRGREGRIAGTLADRAARGITKAIVHVGDWVDLLDTSSLAPISNGQLSLFAETQKDPPPARGPTAVR